jgi:hypothetical protein
LKTITREARVIELQSVAMVYAGGVTALHPMSLCPRRGILIMLALVDAFSSDLRSRFT